MTNFMNMQAVAGPNNPRWTKAKTDAARIVEEAMDDYETGSLGNRERPSDPNIYLALEARIADALFVAGQSE